MGLYISYVGIGYYNDLKGKTMQGWLMGWEGGKIILDMKDIVI